MATTIIHLAIAKELEKDLNIKYKKDYYLGTIAPDISKQIGESKDISHFIINSSDNIPNIKAFTNKYKKFKRNDFELGYFIHLYTDKLWYVDFIPSIDTNKLLENTTKDQMLDMIYSDYTNLNTEIIKKYNLDLSIFSKKFKNPKTIITEVPIDKLDILLNKMNIIIENTKKTRTYNFDISMIENFIDNAVIKIKEELKKY